MNKRIACYGFVKKGGGSITGAHFLILEELLKRGYEIDFYGVKNFNYPSELQKYEKFRLLDAPQPITKAFLRRLFLKYLPKRLQSNIESILNITLFKRFCSNLLKQSIISNHLVNRYDLFLYLGYYSEFQIDDIPIISWIQGPPQTQWKYIQRLRKNIISLCGFFIYFQINIFYILKARESRSKIYFSDVLICGSQWSKDCLIEYGLKPNNIKVLPYPLDNVFFELKSNSYYTEQRRNNNKVFLWLGRSEPRKRLDLLLEAYALLLQERQDIQLKIFGGFSWASGYKKLIDNFEFPEYLEYKPYIDKDQVPELMAKCDILIQPSEGENFGSSVAEALSCGLPVIIGPTNGTKDFISPSSFVFKDYTLESLKITMLRAIEAIDQEPEKLALDSRKTADKNFKVSGIVDSLENIFQETIKSYQLSSTKTTKTSHYNSTKTQNLSIF